jgi:hypothetical protein
MIATSFLRQGTWIATVLCLALNKRPSGFQADAARR